MASAYYFAAHYNPTTQHQPFEVLSALQKHDTPSRVFAPASPRHFVPDGYVDNQAESIFFRLPAELRNQIYNELLCSETPKLKDLAQSSAPTSPSKPVYPAILSTCRKIQDEATEILYSTHVFHAHQSLLTSLPYLQTPANPVVCPSVLSKIKRWQLSIRLDTDPRFTMNQAKEAFSGAEYLELRVWQSMFHGCDCSVLKLFMGIRGVEVAKVEGSVEPELARWLERRMMMPIEEEKKEDVCGCSKMDRDVRCGGCCKKIETAHEWFNGRDVWTFGNR